jgi:hypothetical protein
LALVYEEQYGEAASSTCLQSLSKQVKWMEALYRNVRLPESVRGKGGWRSYAQALVRGRCRIQDTNLNICLNDHGALGFVRMLIDLSPFEWNFYLDKCGQNFHHSLKEHHKISNIPKFLCNCGEMMWNAVNI